MIIVIILDAIKKSDEKNSWCNRINNIFRNKNLTVSQRDYSAQHIIIMRSKLVTILIVLSISLAASINKPQLDLLAPFSSNEVHPQIQPEDVPDVSKLPLQNVNSFSLERSAESRSSDAAAQILRSESLLNLDGSYQYLYETDNGLNVKEQGQPKQIEGSDELAMQVEGGYQYTAPDGAVISMSYIANENGFQPSGDHIPTPPPVPELIQKALKYLLAHPPKNQQ